MFSRINGHHHQSRGGNAGMLFIAAAGGDDGVGVGDTFASYPSN